MTQLIEHLRKELEDGKNTKKRQTISNADLRSAEIMLLKRVSLLQVFITFIVIIILCKYYC